MRVVAIVGAIVLGALLIFVGAFGARWLAPESSGHSDATNPPEAVQQAVPSESVERQLDVAALAELLAILDQRRRNQILESEDNFKKFVEQETLNKAVLAAAYANGADKNSTIQVLMARAGQRVLVEAYLNQVVRLNLDPGFPSNEQVREAYDQNPELFKVPPRMHLWQIFFELSDADDEAASKAAWKQADAAVAALKAGKATFAELAKKYSDHDASRVNDGYMGLIKINELLPPIATAAQALKVDGVSAPVASESGLHIIKRGQMVAEEVLDFAAVEAQVRERLKREATVRVRQAAVEKIAEEFPVTMPSGDLESWRESLRQPAGGSSDPAGT